MSERALTRIFSFLIFLTFDLMLLGAAVRTMDAGLTCPDWPLCFGRAIPNFHWGVYFEFIHRAVAGLLALIFLFCFVVVHKQKEFRHILFLTWVSFLLLLSQIIMGGLTVLKLLEPGIVTLHLTLAGAFLGSLVILKNKLTEELHTNSTVPRFYKVLTLLGLFLVCVQIILGGGVASTYSGSVCLDFPTCMGEWFPTFHGPIGLQVMHRLGAYSVAAVIFVLFFVTLKMRSQKKLDQGFKVLSSQALLLVLSQIAIGIFNLKMQIPAALTILHLAVALMIYLTLLKINIRAHTSP